MIPKPRIPTGYQRELDRLPAAVEFSVALPVDRLVMNLGRVASKPLLAVGSGGSFSVATVAALLHEASTRFLAKAVTPYQALNPPHKIQASALLLSARGRNPDAVTAFHGLSSAVAGPVTALVAASDSTISRLADKSGDSVFSFQLPMPKDGFLATNTLIASSILLAKSYAALSGAASIDFDGIGGPPTWLDSPAQAAKLKEIVRKDTLLVLAGGWGWPAGVDLEGKLSEAGLVPVQLIDFRNFAHGRHFWLARRSESTGVIALATPESAAAAEETIALLPRSVKSTIIVSSRPGPSGAIDLLCQTMHIVHLAGEASNVRLARPGVPTFGRKLYRAGFQRPPENSIRVAALDRKIEAMGVSRRTARLGVESALDAFLERLRTANIEGIATDYDGTLCETSDRESLPDATIRRELIRLLRGGLVVGIATGRGNSVIRTLREWVPQPLWTRLVVGTHSGAWVGSISDNEPTPSNMHPVLVAAKQRLDVKLDSSEVEIHASPQLLSIRLLQSTSIDGLRLFIAEALWGIVDERLVVRSAHSVDVVAPGVTKVTVVEAVASKTRSADIAGVLRLGDQGSWGGNDYELLATGLSLSVDEVSADSEACWNIAPPGYRSTRAAVHYLSALRKERSGFRFRVATSLLAG